MATIEFSDEDKKHLDDFHQAVNMTAKQLTDWLKTEESRSVGQKDSEKSESTGHESGRNIVHLLQKNKNEFTAEDIHQLARVNSYIHRHLAQKPSGDVTETRWRYSLMNWGHDPLRK